MTTTLERDTDKDTKISILRFANGRSDISGTWARMCATIGAAVWAGVAVLARLGIARIGAIELMFLFGRW